MKASDVDGLFPFAHFTVISSPRRSGKSFYVNWLVREGFRPERYSAIFAVSPTMHLQDGLFTFVPKNRMYRPGTPANFEAIIRRVVEFQEARKKDGNRGEVLMLFDDCHASSIRGVARNSAALTKLSANGRHHGVAVIILAQRLVSVPKSCRINADVLITFFLRHENARELVLREWLSRQNTVSRKQTREIAVSVLKEVFDDSSPFNTLVVFPNGQSRTLADICWWSVAEPSTRPVLLKHIAKATPRAQLTINDLAII